MQTSFDILFRIPTCLGIMIFGSIDVRMDPSSPHIFSILVEQMVMNILMSHISVSTCTEKSGPCITVFLDTLQSARNAHFARFWHLASLDVLPADMSSFLIAPSRSSVSRQWSVSIQPVYAITSSFRFRMDVAVLALSFVRDLYASASKHRNMACGSRTVCGLIRDRPRKPLVSFSCSTSLMRLALRMFCFRLGDRG